MPSQRAVWSLLCVLLAACNSAARCTGISATESTGSGSAAATGGAAAATPAGSTASTGTALPDLFSAELFAKMFPHRTDPSCAGGALTYDALVTAARAWPSFAGEGTLAVQKRELAAFLGNVGHETSGG